MFAVIQLLMSERQRQFDLYYIRLSLGTVQ